jgi:hypothetical protein
MSETMNIKTEILDMAALLAACERLGIQMKAGEHHLYQTTETGMGVFLPGWTYPLVVKEGGQVAYDLYGGRWGDEKKPHELTAHYGLEKAKLEARKMGYCVYESRNDQKQVLELRIRL